MWMIQRLLSFILLSSFGVYVNGCPMVNYTGIVNITNGGRVCQSWAGQEPHKHTSNNDAMFVHDGSVEEARNYCRQLVDDPRPWCYTIDIYKRWEHCDLQICDDNGRCGGVITDESGTISSIDADNNSQYDADKDCLWTLMAPDEKFIQLEFLRFDLEPSSSCDLDHLQIYEDTFTHGRYCGATMPPVIISTSRVLYLRFNTDSIEEATGFTARYSHVEEGLADVPQDYVSGELICLRDIDLMRYDGEVSVTNSGHGCLNWKFIAIIPDMHFDVDGSKNEAKAYCRNIDVLPNTMPWCFSSVTMQPEYCQEIICRGLDAEKTDNISGPVAMSTPTTTTVDWPTVDIYTLRIAATLMWTPPYMQSVNLSTINPTALNTNTANHGNVPTVHKNSSTTIQSANQSTPRPNREELETTSVFEQKTVGGNDSTGFRSRVVSTSLRDVSYHTTDSTTKSDVSELSPEIMTLSLVLMTIHVVNENAM